MCAWSNRVNLFQLSIQGKNSQTGKISIHPAVPEQPSPEKYNRYIYQKEYQERRKNTGRRKQSKHTQNFSLNILSTFPKALLPDDAITFLPAVPLLLLLSVSTRQKVTKQKQQQLRFNSRRNRKGDEGTAREKKPGNPQSSQMTKEKKKGREKENIKWRKHRK